MPLVEQVFFRVNRRIRLDLPARVDKASDRPVGRDPRIEGVDPLVGGSATTGLLRSRKIRPLHDADTGWPLQRWRQHLVNSLHETRDHCPPCRSDCLHVVAFTGEPLVPHFIDLSFVEVPADGFSEIIARDAKVAPNLRPTIPHGGPPWIILKTLLSLPGWE